MGGRKVDVGADLLNLFWKSLLGIFAAIAILRHGVLEFRLANICQAFVAAGRHELYIMATTGFAWDEFAFDLPGLLVNLLLGIPLAPIVISTAQMNASSVFVAILLAIWLCIEIRVVVVAAKAGDLV